MSLNRLPLTLRRAMRLITFPLLALGASCASGPLPSAAAVDTVAVLTAQADRWDQAIVAKDRAAIEANMAADFRQIGGAGNVETKASFVDGLMNAELRIDPCSVEEFEVHVLGDVALLRGRTRMTGSYGGKPFSSHYRYIDVYVERGGAWNVVSVQITKLPPPRE